MEGIKALLKNERGVVLVISLMILTLLVGAGVGAIVSTQTDLKTSGNLKTRAEAFYIANAGIHHGWQELDDGDGTNDFADVFDATGTTTLFSNTSFGNGSYTATAVGVPGSIPNRIKVTSTGCLPAGNPCPSGNSKAVIEAQLELFDIGPLPGAITLVGSGAIFTGGNSSSKLLSGDEASGCGTESHPVIAVTDGASKTNVLDEITATNNKPNTYVTSFNEGVADGGKVSDIVASGVVSNINSTYGFDYTNVNDLKDLVDRIEKSADSVVASGGSASLGTLAAPQIVVVNGDFEMKGGDSGVGILVVKGTLKLKGNPSYEGVILAIGAGNIQRSGRGSGEIKGGIIVANIVGSDGDYGTADDVIGSPSLTTTGGGNSKILYCSTVVDQNFSELVDMVTWQER